MTHFMDVETGSKRFSDLSKVTQLVHLSTPILVPVLWGVLFLQLPELPWLWALGVWIRQDKSVKWSRRYHQSKPWCDHGHMFCGPHPGPGQCFAEGCHLSNKGEQAGCVCGGRWFCIGILYLCGYWFLSQRVPSAFYLIMLLIFIPVLWGFLSLFYKGAGFQGYQESIDWSLSLAFLERFLSVEILLFVIFIFCVVCGSQLFFFTSACS